MSLTTSWDLQGYLFGLRFVLIIIIFLGISALLGFFYGVWLFPFLSAFLRRLLVLSDERDQIVPLSL